MNHVPPVVTVVPVVSPEGSDAPALRAELRGSKTDVAATLDAEGALRIRVQREGIDLFTLELENEDTLQSLALLSAARRDDRIRRFNGETR